jgi:hypothetical protein
LVVAHARDAPALGGSDAHRERIVVDARGHGARAGERSMRARVRRGGSFETASARAAARGDDVALVVHR